MAEYASGRTTNLISDNNTMSFGRAKAELALKLLTVLG